MGLLVKICGINSAEAADAAARAGGDLAGLAFHPKSPRNVQPEQARALADRMRGKMRLVVLLSDPSDDALASAVSAVTPDFIQLHGAETPDRVAAIRGRFKTGIIKAFAVAVASDLTVARKYEDHADMLLFDAKPPAGSATRRWAWRRIRLANSERTDIRAALASRRRVEPCECRTRNPGQ